MHNEIYARHSYSFISADLQGYFGAQPWYTASNPDAEAVYATMTPVERSNVLAIRAEECNR